MIRPKSWHFDKTGERSWQCCDRKGSKWPGSAVAEAQDGCWRHMMGIAGKGKLLKNPHQYLEEGQYLLNLVNKVGTHNCS